MSETLIARLPDKRAKALKLLEALGEEHENVKTDGDHQWRKCRHCLAEFEVNTYPAARELLRELVATIQEQAEEITHLQKENRILQLATPLEEDLSNNIDEMCRHLATEQGYTLVGIARLFIECQRRMAADWAEIGSLRRHAKEQAEAITHLHNSLDLCTEHAEDAIQLRNKQLEKAEEAITVLQQAMQRNAEILARVGKHPSNCPRGVGIGLYVPPVDAKCTCGLSDALEAAASLRRDEETSK